MKKAQNNGVELEIGNVEKVITENQETKAIIVEGKKIDTDIVKNSKKNK